MKKSESKKKSESEKVEKVFVHEMIRLFMYMVTGPYKKVDSTLVFTGWLFKRTIPKTVYFYILL